LQNEQLLVMDFSIEKLTEQVAQTARDFAQKHIKPYVMQWDESQEFPIETLKELGKTGFMGVFVPEEYGGAGLSYFEYKVVIACCTTACASV
jgi:alkylation response protein AidB-like acyl-CoA dehydrogenase